MNTLIEEMNAEADEVPGYREAHEKILRAERALKFDMVDNRVIFTNRIHVDCWIYLMNQHNLMSMIGAHPLNPLSSRERIMLLLAQILISFFTAGAVHLYWLDFSQMIAYQYVSIMLGSFSFFYSSALKFF
eukprot:307787_1